MAPEVEKHAHTLLRFAFRFAQTKPKEKSKNVLLRTQYCLSVLVPQLYTPQGSKLLITAV
jgi:hypothetical protein